MKWRRDRNICKYWDCNERIPNDEFLCAGHHQRWLDGLVDRCPKCSRFKDVMYYLCLDCYFGRPVAPQKLPVVTPAPNRQYKVQYSDAWTDGYMRPERCFVYILRLDDGNLYIGHARDIRKHLSVPKERKTSSTPGRTPELQYLEIAATERDAELRQAELEGLTRSNPVQIQLMITEFQNRLREFGLK